MHPRAIAFQTFKSTGVARQLLGSPLIDQIGTFCQPAFITSQAIRLDLALPESGAWIAYPYSVEAGLAAPFCMVYREGAGLFRHIRCYAEVNHAEHDNTRISKILQATRQIFQTVPSPSQAGQHS